MRQSKEAPKLQAKSHLLFLNRNSFIMIGVTPGMQDDVVVQLVAVQYLCVRACVRVCVCVWIESLFFLRLW